MRSVSPTLSFVPPSTVTRGRGEVSTSRPFGGADFVDAEKMSAIADDYQPPQPVGAGDDGDAARRFLGIAALGLGDNVFFGNAHAHQVFAAYGAFVVLIAAVSAQGDDERSDAAVIERECVIQAGAVNRGGPAVVLRRAKNANRVRRRGLILTRVALNLHIDPAAPAQCPNRNREQQHHHHAENPFAPLRLGPGLALHKNLRFSGQWSVVSEQ